MGRTPIRLGFVLCLGLGACSRETLDSHEVDMKAAREAARETVDQMAAAAKVRGEELKARIPEVQEGLRKTYEAAKIRADELKEKLPSEEEMNVKYEEARIEARRLRDKLPSNGEIQDKIDRASEAVRETAHEAREATQRQVEDARLRMKERL